MLVFLIVCFLFLIVVDGLFAEGQSESKLIGLPRSFMSLSLGIHSHFLIFSIYAVVFKCPSL